MICASSLLMEAPWLFILSTMARYSVGVLFFDLGLPIS
jgi:hypothetical protein